MQTSCQEISASRSAGLAAGLGGVGLPRFAAFARTRKASRKATRYNQPPMDSCLRIERAFRASTRKVAWKTSSASAPSRRILQPKLMTIAPWRRTRTVNASSFLFMKRSNNCRSVHERASRPSASRRMCSSTELICRVAIYAGLLAKQTLGYYLSS